jgi:hypothetical protein
MWTLADALWEEFARREGGGVHFDPSFRVVGDAVADLREVLRDLADVIPPANLALLRAEADRYERVADELFASWESGRLDLSPASEGVRSLRSVDRGLREACDRALGDSHPLRPVLGVGAGCGQFDVQVTNFSSMRYIADLSDHAGESPGPGEPLEVPLPSIRDLATRASLLPDAILDRSPLLKSLSRIAVDYDEIGDEPALERYFEETQERWRFLARRREFDRRCRPRFILPDGRVMSPPDTEDEGIDFRRPLFLRDMANEQPELIEAELSEIPEEQFEHPPRRDAATEITWDRGEGALRIGSQTVCAVSRQAANLRAVLGRFQEAGWPESILNPFRADGIPDPDRLDSAIKGLNKKTAARLSFSRRRDRVYRSVRELPELPGELPV